MRPSVRSSAPLPGATAPGQPAPAPLPSPRLLPGATRENNVAMRITVLAGGLGGARFLHGVRALLGIEAGPGPTNAEPDGITVVGNTGDDLWLFGLKVCPDLDTIMYSLGGGLDEERTWGRAAETFNAAEELRAYGAQPDWFGLGDRDIGTHLMRTQLLEAGYPLSAVTAALCQRWQPGVRLLPMTDDRVETHVVITDDQGRRAIHFQEWWVRLHAEVAAETFVMVGADEATPGPGVVEAIMTADVVLLPPSNPVVSIGAIASVPGIATALRSTEAPVVGVSGLVSGAPVRGMADACLSAIGVEPRAGAVALHYAARPTGFLDGWLVDIADAGEVDEVVAAGIACRAVPTMMTDRAAAAALVGAGLDLAAELRSGR